MSNEVLQCDWAAIQIIPNASISSHYGEKVKRIDSATGSRCVITLLSKGGRENLSGTGTWGRMYSRIKMLQDRDGIECPQDRDVKVPRGEQEETEDDVPTPLTHECCMQPLPGSTANEAQTYAIELAYMSEKHCFIKCTKQSKTIQDEYLKGIIMVYAVHSIFPPHTTISNTLWNMRLKAAIKKNEKLQRQDLG